MSILISVVALAVIISSILFASVIVQVNDEDRAKQRWLGALAKAYPDSRSINDGKVALVLDSANQHIIVVDTRGDGHVFKFDHVASVELKDEYVTTTYTDSRSSPSRLSQLAGATIGGAVAGVPGIIVGGLTPSSRTASQGSSNQSLSVLELKIRMLCDTAPLVKVREQKNFELAETIAAMLTNVVEMRQTTPSKLVGEPITIRIPVFSDDELAAMPAPLRRGWWQRTFGS